MVFRINSYVNRVMVASFNYDSPMVSTEIETHKFCFLLKLFNAMN